MLIELYPNNELRCTWGSGYAPVKADERKESRGVRPLLDIPSQPSQAMHRRERKRHPMTKKARHRMLHHAGLFDHKNKKKQLFLTGTLPGSSDDALDAFTSLAPHVVKSVQTYLPRAISVSAKEIKYIWVWELQKRGALHMHMIVECESRESADLLLREWRGIWVSALKSAANKTGVDIFERKHGGTHKDREHLWQIDAQRVRKSVSRYLSKYQSKGSEGDRRYFPPRWYGVSTALRAELREWRKGHSELRWGRVSPEVSMNAARLVVEELMKEFCVGDVRHKHGYGDVGGVDVFGYARENLDIVAISDFIEGTLREWGVMIPLKKLEITEMDYGRACRRLAKIIEREMPPEEFEEFMYRFTQELWDRFSDREVAGRNEFTQAFWTLTFMFYDKGFTFVGIPNWATNILEAYNAERARFPDNLNEPAT